MYAMNKSVAAVVHHCPAASTMGERQNIVKGVATRGVNIM